jgi:hypothetical protein
MQIHNKWHNNLTGSTNRHYDITQQHVLPPQPPLPAAAAAAATTTTTTITTTTTTTTPKKPLLIYKLILEKYSSVFTMAIFSTYIHDFYVGCTYYTNTISCMS